ncbi:hypothetical protein [Pseudomonas sp. Irchel 3A7]|uniref:hypothetical protein n=1 Tax=Pseudomonas sp. Irchel 3A7 TaxID=2008913 RepID=UPI000BA3EEEE|nr:hypothetical protein [Pseudomonas sp. Irchel 3A7]
MTQWRFSNSVEDARQEKLFSVSSFAAVADQIEREMLPLCYHLQACDDDSRYARPIFCVRVSEDLFDAFFNSPNGYRGSYFTSPSVGLESNRYLMNKLLPRLCSWALQNSPGFNTQFALDALSAISAKAWLAEISLELCSACLGEWSSRSSDEQAEIINGRWELSTQSNSMFGRKAPRHSKIRLFGAFLNNRGDEFIPARKRHRDADIHDDGWS